MCTLVVAVGAFAEAPLLLAANRDEMLLRPAVPPLVWPGPPRFVAPRDELAGGTWLGVGEHGVVVGVTNRAGAPRDATRRSRGALVVDALLARSAASLREQLERLDPGRHNPFHLVYGDRAAAHLSWSDGAVVHHAELGPGLHVVTERSPGVGAGGPDTPRAERVHAAWRATVAGRPLSAAALHALLRQHAPAGAGSDPFAATCIHADAFGYGTRSSALLALGAGGGAALSWAEGKPCVTPYEDASALLGSIGLAPFVLPG